MNAKTTTKLGAGLAALGLAAGLFWMPKLEALPHTARLTGQSAALRVHPAGRPALPQAAESSNLLVVGGALMGFGLVGRKRRTARASAGR